MNSDSRLLFGEDENFNLKLLIFISTCGMILRWLLSGVHVWMPIDTLQRFKGHLRLEIRRITLPHVCH
jgi:hypothetical protein